MKTIIFASQKGGSGKTTLAAHLAVEAERAGDKPVFLIDTDRQQTLAIWHERRKKDTPNRAEVRIDRIEDALATLASQGAAYCLIDTAPTISEQTQKLISLADFVIIPVRPSPADLWSVGETLNLVQKAQKPFIFVITQAKPNTTITAQAIAALSEHGRVAKAFIADRVSYASAMTGGDTAPENSPKSRQAEEVTALWLELKSCFAEKLKSGKGAAHNG